MTKENIKKQLEREIALKGIEINIIKQLIGYDVMKFNGKVVTKHFQNHLQKLDTDFYCRYYDRENNYMPLYVCYYDRNTMEYNERLEISIYGLEVLDNKKVFNMDQYNKVLNQVLDNRLETLENLMSDYKNIDSIVDEFNIRLKEFQAFAENKSYITKDNLDLYKLSYLREVQ